MAICDPEPQRPDRHQRRDQPLPRIGRSARDRPQRAAGADQAERKGPDRIDPAGIAGALLHHPGARHQDRERHGDRRQRLEIQNVMQNPGWTTNVYKIRSSQSPVSARSSPLVWPETGLSDLFSPPRCAILAPQTRLFATDDTRNALRPLRPLRNGDRADQTVVAPDFPGADAGVPGAVRAGHGGALQADRRPRSSPIPASTP